ncbi:MAG: adenylate/guanylate cyclase domain-containing protein [Pseudomonadota bacterium]
MRATASEDRLRDVALAWAAGVGVLLLVWAASFSRPWHALEFKTFDVLTALTAPQAVQHPVVILAIDEPTFQAVQQHWPFPRSLHARLIERVHADGAAAIGFDVVFADPTTEAEDAALERAVAKAAPVALASAREKIDSGNATLWTDVPPLPRLLAAGGQAGSALVQPDDDFVVRRAFGDEDSLAMRLAQRAAGGRAIGPQPAEWLAYRGPRSTFDTRSYYQALEPGLLPAGFFKGKIVLVGRSARSASELENARADLFNSPFGTVGGDRLFPGVELQATQVDNLLAGDGLRSVPGHWTLALVLLMAPLMAWAGRRLPLGWAVVLAAAVVAAMAFASWLLFALLHLWWPPLLPMVSTLGLASATALLGYATVRKRSQQTRAMFAQYVPPAVVARLVAEPGLMRLGGEVREVTIMFTDLANFTTLSERLSAEQTVDLLTGYFDAMTPIIHASGGTVDKFIGDAVMAFWGAPLDDAQHAEHAVHAALDMQQAMEPLVAALRARGLPPLQMRIGLHTGRVVVGNVGSQQRFSYTVIGDAVNLAARLEGANKAFGTGILLSGATARQLPAFLPVRVLDEVIVKGRAEPVRVFTLCADSEACALSAAALDAFQVGDAATAAAHLDQLLQRCPGDPAALRLRARVAEAAALPAGAPWPTAVALDKL